ncbi:MAG: PQQ-binding-like beta-propeller repeat protein, partial [Burkholderiales bacterium]
MKISHHVLGAMLALVFCGAQAQNDEALKNDGKSTSDVLTYGMGYNNQRYSPLTQVNTKSVGKLVPVWAYSLNNTQSHESQPIVYQGIMYVTTHDATVAINAETGKQLWRTAVELPQDVFKYACCGILNRGAAIYNGKVYRTTLDAQVIALDAQTGKQLWKSKAADYQDGQAQTGAPLVVGGVVMTGIAGGEYGTRGFIDGWDANDGHKLWRLY